LLFLRTSIFSLALHPGLVKMLTSLLTTLLLAPALAYANNDGKTTGNPSWDNSLRTPFTPIALNASDGSISATFIPYGATLTNLYGEFETLHPPCPPMMSSASHPTDCPRSCFLAVADKNGVKQDIVLGYDNLANYSLDASHPNFGPIVGRYANRIKNNTYTDPVTGQEYYSVANENNGTDTLHGGPYG
jgi:aldose 1-epimerase